MSRLKLQLHFNKGHEGIALDKLERIVEDLRKFLASLSDDIELLEPGGWVGTEFKTASLQWTSVYPHDVESPKLARFNSSMLALARSEFPPTLDESTANKFFDLVTLLDSDQKADMTVFSEDGSPIEFEVSEETAKIARHLEILPFRETLGAIQGVIHSLHNGSKPYPYFTLRELSTRHLVNCRYRPEDYSRVVEALNPDGQIIHVWGTVVSNTRTRQIDHITVREIKISEPYGYEDVERFLKKGT